MSPDCATLTQFSRRDGIIKFAVVNKVEVGMARNVLVTTAVWWRRLF